MELSRLRLIRHINANKQQLRFCVTHAHHQNEVGEYAIQTVSNISRVMLLHASVHWKESDIGPMASCMLPISTIQETKCAPMTFFLAVKFLANISMICMFGVF